MAVNRFFRRTPYDIGLYVPPVQVIEETLNLHQQKYDENYLLASKIKDHFIRSLPQDRATANTIQAQWMKQVDELTAKHHGNYAKAGKDIGNLLSDIKREYNPGGKAFAITSNLQTYEDWSKRHQERVAKGDVLGEDMNLANSYFMKNYTGIGEVDPVTGSYNQFRTEELTPFRNPEEIILKTLPGFKPEKRKVGRTYFENGKQIYRETDEEYLDPNKLYQGFSAALQSDPQMMNYMIQRARFSGMEPEDAMRSFDQYTKQRAQSYSYLNKSDIEKAERDPLYLLQMKHKLDKEAIDYQHSLMSYGETAGTGMVTRGASKLDHNDWTTSFGVQNPTYTESVLVNGVLVHMPAKSGSSFAHGNLQEFLSTKNADARLRDKNVIPDLFRTMWEDNKKMLGPDFEKRYGKDKEYTKKVEKDFIWNYNQEQGKNHSMYQTYEEEIPNEKARNAQGMKALRLGLNGQALIYTPGSAEGRKEIPSDMLESITNDKGEIDLSYANVTRVRPGQGIAVAGIKISTKNGSFIVEDPNINRTGYAEELRGAFNPIFFEGKSSGSRPVRVGVDDNNQWIKMYPFRTYERQGDGSYDMKIRFKKNPNDSEYTQWDMSMDQIQENYNQAFKDQYGAGASKADQTWFNFYGTGSPDGGSEED